MAETGIHGRHLDIFLRRGGTQQVVALEYEAEGLAAQPGQAVGVKTPDVPAGKQVCAIRRAVEAAEDIHQRGFAGTGLADNGQELTRVYF